MKISLAQIDVIPGKPFENAKKMNLFIDKVRGDSPDLILFSENVIPGYLIGDNWERSDFIADCVQASNIVVEHTKGLTVAFGTVVPHQGIGEDGRPKKLNVVLLAKDGKLVADWAAVKTLMPNYREFDDSRHFFDGRKMLLNNLLGNEDLTTEEVKSNQFRTFDIAGKRVSFLICEDAWQDDYFFKPFTELAKKSDLICNLSCSPYTFSKNNKRNKVFSELCRTNEVPMVYVNNVGCQNNGKNVFVFDGNSCIYDKNGGQINPFSYFEENILTINVELEKEFGRNRNFNENNRELYLAIKYSTKKFLEQNKIKTVVIGASGGIDSCLAAAIYADIIPKENLHLINMPYKWNSNTTISIAKKLAENIGCVYKSIPIYKIVDPIDNIMSELGTFEGINSENAQARARLQILASYASLVGGVFTCNSNKSEMTVGYCTFYGDLGGFFANLADLWKTQVYDLAKWYNTYIKNIIPEAAFTVKPSAELSSEQNVDQNKGDPLNYEYHDKLFYVWVERWNRATLNDVLKWYKDGTIDQELGFNGVKSLFPSYQSFEKDATKWWNAYNGLSIAKRVQSPPIATVSRRSFGFDLRESLNT